MIFSIRIGISTRFSHTSSLKTLKIGLNLKNRRFNKLRFMSESTTAEPTPPAPPWLIVGLGNRGFVFNGTRHNVGFEMVDRIANAEGISLSSGSFKSLLGEGHIGNIPVLLCKPQTFMNASGQSVGAIVAYYKIPLKQVLLIYDDLDLPFAKLRLLSKGGHGGHNGMKSVIHHLGGRREFPRLRIGIGRPSGRIEAFNFVLRAFSNQESEEVLIRVQPSRILQNLWTVLDKVNCLTEELEFTFQKGLEAVRILLFEGSAKSATFANTRKTTGPYWLE